ncbi:MAG: hypothetical protein JO032_02890 [Alphaproteobacteria bacterium]|nr:hypothetical protein [Alphaproteobacteria bacterium]
MSAWDSPTETEASGRPAGSLAVPAPLRHRLAIVSTSNKLCGIAAYTQALEGYLGDIFDVRVFDLDQYLLRGRHKRVRTLGDRHIKAICREIAGFDAVNIQLEYGTLGATPRDICRRFAWLAAAAPRVSVTFHTLKRPPLFPLGDFIGALVTLRWRTVGDIYGEFARSRALSLQIPRRLRQAQRRKPVCAIVHNRRDRSDLQHLGGLHSVLDHPLAFLPESRAQTVQASVTRQRFPLLEALPRDAVLTGVFGFINDYKGFSTAVRALHHLSPRHHLLIFGGTHPNEIPARQPIHSHVQSLLHEAYLSGWPPGDEGEGRRKPATKPGGLGEDATSHPVAGRVHFMGVLDDDDFLAGMALCDVVVFPYMEVGQSSSGPIAIAVELGKRIIASRTHAFLDFAAYHPLTIEFFDIGNHLELAKRIAARRQYPARREPPLFNVETNKAVYLAANSAPAAAEAIRRGRPRLQRTIVGAQR